MSRLPIALRARGHAAELQRLQDATRRAFVDTGGWDPAAALPGDLGRVLLDAAATGLHVLRVYQEGWGREGFLATASRPDALFALVADLGYHPAPGVSAVGFQQLRCRSGAGGPVATGFQVLSSASGEEKDAVFETLHPLLIHPAFNQMRVVGVAAPGSEEATDGGTNAAGSAGDGAASGDGASTAGTPATPGAPILPPPGLSAAGALGAFLEGRNTSYRAAASAGRARARIKELAASRDALAEAGVLTEEAEAALCALACATEPPGNPVALPPSPMQRLMADEVKRLSPDAKTALDRAVAACDGSEAERNARLDALATMLDALGEGLARGARDAVILTEGLAAIRRMEQLFSAAAGATTASAGTTALVLAPDPSRPPLRAGDWLVVAERVADGDVLGRQAIRLSSVEGDTIRFTPPLFTAVSIERMVLLGNIALVSEGRTIEEALVRADDGPLPLPADVTWLRDASAAGGRRPAVAVDVNGRPWPRVERLVGVGPTTPAFRVETAADALACVWFGDGVEGAAVPSGASIRLRYRVGRGVGGVRAAGRLDTVAGESPYVDTTWNPLPTWGGAEGETIDEARVRAPSAVRAMDRAVSFEDLGAVAARFDGVSHARVFQPAGSPRGTVTVVVAGPGATALPAPTLGQLADFLRSRVPPGVRIELRSPMRIGVRMTALVRGRPGADPVQTLRETREALGVELGVGPGLLSPARLRLDEDLHLSAIYTAFGQVEAVRGAVVSLLHRIDAPRGLASRVVAAPDEVLAWDNVELRFEEDVDR